MTVLLRREVMRVTRRSGITQGASPKSAARGDGLGEQFSKLKQREVFEIVKSARPRNERGEPPHGRP
jgi:hypothetical protein